jgi:arylsulfatase A-like enzyme
MISCLDAQIGQVFARLAELYWEFRERSFGQAVRMGRWKAIRPKPGAPLKLYDLASDLSEQHDIAPAHPEILARFEAILATARTDSPHWPVDLQGDCETAAVGRCTRQ